MLVVLHVTGVWTPREGIGSPGKRRIRFVATDTLNVLHLTGCKVPRVVLTLIFRNPFIYRILETLYLYQTVPFCHFLTNPAIFCQILPFFDSSCPEYVHELHEFHEPAWRQTGSTNECVSWFLGRHLLGATGLRVPWFAERSEATTLCECILMKIQFVLFVLRSDIRVLFSFRAYITRGLYLLRRASEFGAQLWSFPTDGFPQLPSGRREIKIAAFDPPRVATTRFVCDFPAIPVTKLN